MVSPHHGELYLSHQTIQKAQKRHAISINLLPPTTPNLKEVKFKNLTSPFLLFFQTFRQHLPEQLINGISGVGGRWFATFVGQFQGAGEGSQEEVISQKNQGVSINHFCGSVSKQHILMFSLLYCKILKTRCRDNSIHASHYTNK